MDMDVLDRSSRADSSQLSATSYQPSAISCQLSAFGGEDRCAPVKHDIRDETIIFTSITDPFNSSNFVLSRYSSSSTSLRYVGKD